MLVYEKINNLKQKTIITLNDREIERVDDFTHVGGTKQNNRFCKDSKYITKRAFQVKKAFNKNYVVLW